RCAARIAGGRRARNGAGRGGASGGSCRSAGRRTARRQQGRGAMNRPHYILLPVSPLFIAFSLTCAFMLNLLPWGRWIGAPDFVALVLVFWGMHQPRKVGIGVAFFMGVMLDMHDSIL